MDGSSCVLLISRGRQTVQLFFLTIIITKQFKLFTTLHFQLLKFYGTIYELSRQLVFRKRVHAWNPFSVHLVGCASVARCWRHKDDSRYL